MDLNCTQDNNYAGLLEDSTQDQGGSNEGTPFADLHLSQDYDNIRDPLIDLVSTKDTNVFLTTFPHGQLGESTTPIKVQKKKKDPYPIQRKKCRNSGQHYFTKNGKFIADKMFKMQACRCLYECKSIDLEERKCIFNRFWSSREWLAQLNYTISTVSVFEPKRRTKKRLEDFKVEIIPS